jgi:hypothetical protein
LDDAQPLIARSLSCCPSQDKPDAAMLNAMQLYIFNTVNRLCRFHKLLSD